MIAARCAFCFFVRAIISPANPPGTKHAQVSNSNCAPPRFNPPNAQADRSAVASGAMTRDEQVRVLADDLKIRARIFSLKRLATQTATALDRANSELAEELRAMINDEKLKN
jgi:hypothetical protein